MQYINKANNYDEGTRITDEYLESPNCKVEDPLSHEISYINIDYAGTFSSCPSAENSYKRQMKDVVLRNQSHLCCYCMRRLETADDVDLEHIIPQSTRNVDVNYYRSAPGLSEGDIVLTKDYIRAHNQERPPYPHTVAYNNLVASCYGTFPKMMGDEAELCDESICCNNVRKNYDAYPIYYIENVSDLIIYHKWGNLYENPDSPMHEKVRDVIVHAKLKCETLQSIRQLWYVLRNYPIEQIYECQDDGIKRKGLLAEALDNSDLSPMRIGKLMSQFEKQEYWKTFMLYDWFKTANWDESESAE